MCFRRKKAKKQEVKEIKKVNEPKKEEVKEQPKEEKQVVENKIYHVSKRKEDGKWQVKFANGEKAIKLFDTQAEAIDYAKHLAETQDGSIQIHKVDGSIRKQDYSK